MLGIWPEGKWGQFLGMRPLATVVFFHREAGFGMKSFSARLSPSLNTFLTWPPLEWNAGNCLSYGHQGC